MAAVFLLLATASAWAQGAPATCWNLVWSDEFDETSLNTANWNFETGCSAYGNNELENYTTSPTNAYLQNGNLVIQAVNTGGGMCGYTSARLTTKGKVHMTYGRVEARIKAPYGQGIWPAFWMLGSDIDTNPWPACGEIDIMEMIGGGSGRDNVNYGTAHWNNGGAVQSGSSISIPWPAKLSDDYHLYAIEWNATSITWYFDGTAYYTLSTTPTAMSAFQGKDFYILLNIAVGGTWPGSPDGTTVFPQYMYVDYVRWYQQGTCSATNTPTTTPTPTATQTPTKTFNPTSTATNTPVNTPTNTCTSTSTGTLTPTPTATRTASMTATPSFTSTPSASGTNTATVTATRTTTLTATSINSATLTPTNSATSTVSFTSTYTATKTNTPSVTFTPTSTATATVTSTPTNTPTGTLPPTSTFTDTGTPTPTSTPSNTATDSTTQTPSGTASSTSSPSPSSTPTLTATPSATAPRTATPSPTWSTTSTPTLTTTDSTTVTPSSSPTLTWTVTATITATATATASPSPTPTATSTITANPTHTYTPTTTNTPSSTATQTPTNASTDTTANSPTATQTPTTTFAWTAVSTTLPTPAFLNNNVVVIYPNPVAGNSVEILPPPHSGIEEVNVRLFTLAFRKVLEKNFPSLQAGEAVKIELKDRTGNPLSNGLYYVTVGDGGRPYTVKLLVIR